MIIVGLIGVITYNLTSASNHKREENHIQTAFHLIIPLKLWKIVTRSHAALWSLCVWCPHFEQDALITTSLKTLVYLGQKATSHATKWTSGLNYACVSTWMITLEAPVQWVGWNGWTHPVHLRLGLTDGGLDQSQKCCWRAHDPESTWMVPLWGFSWVCFATHNLGCGK